MTRITSLFYLLTVWCFSAFGQGLKFDSNDFPSDKYLIDTTTVSLSECTLTIITTNLIERDRFKGTNIWLLRQFTGDSIASTYLGETNDEYGFYAPEPQPLNDFYILVEDIEGSGIIHLIDNKGQWTKIEGNTFSFNVQTNTLATKNTGDGDHQLSKLSLVSMEVEVKTWNNGNRIEPWEGFANYYQPTANNWLK
jgi:hypothetical protein